VHDFNADGHPDLYTTRLSTAQLAVLLGQGDGSFVEAPRLPLPAPPVAAVAFDAHGDGRTDLVTADGAGTLCQWRGNGLGAFSPESTWEVGERVQHLAACDVDRDGDADLAVLTARVLLVWRAAGGRFAFDTVYAAGPGATRLAVADVNADRWPDLAVALGAQRSARILTGDASGRFVKSVELAFADSVGSVEVADVDADGDLDVVFSGDRSVGVAYFGTGSDVADGARVLPTAFELSQNVPNPFNPATEIAFAVPTPAHVVLDVFNILGRRVAVLKDEVMAAGYYSVTWEGRSERGEPLPSGVYFFRLRSEAGSLTRRMLLLK
jgi:hypothetical protein